MTSKIRFEISQVEPPRMWGPQGGVPLIQVGDFLRMALIVAH